MGSEVARRGIGLGFANVIAYDPYASEVKAVALGVKLVSWEEALAQADFFSLHMPQTPQTKVCWALSVLHASRTLHDCSKYATDSPAHLTQCTYGPHSSCKAFFRQAQEEVVSLRLLGCHQHACMDAVYVLASGLPANTP